VFSLGLFCLEEFLQREILLLSSIMIIMSEIKVRHDRGNVSNAEQFQKRDESFSLCSWKFTKGYPDLEAVYRWFSHFTSK
jgi:hypothetical protein